MNALKIYARPVHGGYWMIKPEIQQRINEHSEMISIIAHIGKKQGYDIWIGKREQHERPGGIIKDVHTLAELMTLKSLKVKNGKNQSVLENIDILWIKNEIVISIFEVESTTTMTSALMRGSNLEHAVDKYMILPEEREHQFNNKYKSPLFKDHFENENWKLIYFDKLRNSYINEKNKLDIKNIIDKKHISSTNFKSLRVIFPEACLVCRAATNLEIPRSLLRGGSLSGTI
jgi:hypothetical protein